MHGPRWMSALLVAGMLVAGTGSLQAQSDPNLDARRQALLDADSAFLAATAEGASVADIVSYWTDDAVVYPPGQPALRGKEDIRKYVAGAMKIDGFRIRWETHDVRLGPSGEMGYLTHTNRVTAPDSTGDLVTTHGKGVTIWRWTDDGRWRCVVDIWNERPADASSM